MINTQHFREYVIDPVLRHLNLYSRAASNLMLGTALQESRLFHMKQVGDGPAVGFYQMEPATFDDIWDNYLIFNPYLKAKVQAFAIVGLPLVMAPASEMIGNVYLATAMCRIHYLRVEEALPNPNDASGLAQYWKKYYNTPKGKGNVFTAVINFREAVQVV